MMDDKITIIEGPPPTFEIIRDGWAFGLLESSELGDIAVTRLRTLKGEELVQRCRSAWDQQVPIYLQFRNYDGLEQEAPIMAAKNVQTEEGDMLILWIRVDTDELDILLEEDDSDSDFDIDDNLDISE